MEALVVADTRVACLLLNTSITIGTTGGISVCVPLSVFFMLLFMAVVRTEPWRPFPTSPRRVGTTVLQVMTIVKPCLTPLMEALTSTPFFSPSLFPQMVHTVAL